MTRVLLFLFCLHCCVGSLRTADTNDADIISVIKGMKKVIKDMNEELEEVKREVASSGAASKQSVQSAKKELREEFGVVDKTIVNCPEFRTDYSGNNIKVVQGVSSWRVCSKHCRENDNCRAWSYLTDKWVHSTKKYCYLKSSDAGRTQGFQGVISGSVECGALGLALEEIKFTGGTPGASSVFDATGRYAPKNAFLPVTKSFWASGRDDKGNGPLAVSFPHIIWYDFPRAFIPGQVSFRASPTDGSKTNGFVGASKFQFVGTNDVPCNKYSKWTVLCEDLSGNKFTRRTQSKYCNVDVKRRDAFRCVGISVLDSEYEGTYFNVELTGIRMWKMV